MGAYNTIGLSGKRCGPRWFGPGGGAILHSLPRIVYPDYKRGGHEQEQAALISYRGVQFLWAE